MPTTSNFGWTTPADTDLVKDGAAAIRTLGNGIDTSLVDLKGGTTGQILSKASNTDLDYTWINNDQGDLTGLTAGVGISITSATGPVPTITNSSTDLITTAGDILYGTAADTVARLGIGTAGQVLTVNTGATAPEWKTAASGAVSSWTLLNAGGTALTGATTVTVSGISNQKQIFVYIDSGSSANTGAVISVRPNADNAANYTYAGPIHTVDTTYSSNDLSATATYSGGTEIPVGRMGNNAADAVVGGVLIESCDSTGWKFFTSTGTGNGTGTGTRRAYWLQGLWEASAAITSIQIVSSSGNFDSGTVYVFGGA